MKNNAKEQKQRVWKNEENSGGKSSTQEISIDTGSKERTEMKEAKM